MMCAMFAFLSRLRDKYFPLHSHYCDHVDLTGHRCGQLFECRCYFGRNERDGMCPDCVRVERQTW